MLLYLLWQSTKEGYKLMGVATSKEQAKRLCIVTGDAYMQIQSDVCIREDVDTTPLCKYKLPDRTFGSHEDLEKALKDKATELGDINKVLPPSIQYLIERNINEN